MKRVCDRTESNRRMDHRKQQKRDMELIRGLLMLHEFGSNYRAEIKELSGKIGQASRRLKLDFVKIAEQIRQSQPIFKTDLFSGLAKTAESTRKIAKLPDPIRQFRTDWAKLAESARQFEAKLPDKLKTLAKHGWFISLWTPTAAISHWSSLFERDKVEEGHQVLCRYFNQELPNIERRITGDFPRRATILKKAFKAHRQGDYELSIPVFLAQADGIARDAIAKAVPGFSVFSKRSVFKNLTKQYITDYVGEEFITRQLVDVVLEKLPLTANENDSKVTQEVLNRHTILHGTNTSYANERNSCRAISVLEYSSIFHSILLFAKIGKRSS